jgi:hypothetical protein
VAVGFTKPNCTELHATLASLLFLNAVLEFLLPGEEELRSGRSQAAAEQLPDEDGRRRPVPTFKTHHKPAAFDLGRFLQLKRAIGNLGDLVDSACRCQ